MGGKAEEETDHPQTMVEVNGHYDSGSSVGMLDAAIPIIVSIVQL